MIDSIKTVLFGLIGVRRKADHEKAELNPLHLILAGITLVILFILTLVTVVNIVTG